MKRDHNSHFLALNKQGDLNSKPPLLSKRNSFNSLSSLDSIVRETGMSPSLLEEIETKPRLEAGKMMNGEMD